MKMNSFVTLSSKIVVIDNYVFVHYYFTRISETVHHMYMPRDSYYHYTLSIYLEFMDTPLMHNH